MAGENFFLEAFHKADKSEWQRVASSEIQGDNPLEALQWHTPEGLSFKPYYDRSDLASLSYLEKFNFPDASSEYTHARAWQNIPPVTVREEGAANAMALEHLKNEADGILFLIEKTDLNFNKLLDHIEWEYCSISFIIHADFPLADLSAYIQKKYPNKSVSGTLFWQDSTQAQALPETWAGLKSFGIYIKSASPTEEIADALTQAVKLTYRFQEKGLSTESILKNISFSIPSGNNFLLQASKLKALRMLWYQVMRAFKITTAQPEDLHIHTRSEAWIQNAYQPHGNLLSNTISTMAAIAGGCNAHTAYPEHESETMMSRIARNTSFVLRDEAYFGKVADPFAGSYAIENMVHELAKAAWEELGKRC